MGARACVRLAMEHPVLYVPRRETQVTTPQRANKNLSTVSIDPDHQALLVAAHQRGVLAGAMLSSHRLRGSAATTARKAVSHGEIAAVELFESIRALINTIADEYTKNRLGEEWARSQRDDMRSEAVVAAFEAIASYDPDRGTSVSQWVGREVRNHLTTIEFDPAGGTRPREWRKVAKVAHMVLERAGSDASLRTPTGVQDAVWNYFFQETCTRIEEANPELTTDEVQTKARARLSRQSITRSVTRELTDIMATAPGALSLNTASPSGEGELLDSIADGNCNTELLTPELAVRKLLSTLDDEDISLALTSSGGVVPQDSSRTYATKYGITLASARAELASMSGRVSAPHAQFCALWDGFEAQFEESSALPTSNEDLLNAHRGRF